MLLIRWSILLILSIMMLNACKIAKHTVDAIFYNGKIYTIDNKFTVKEGFAIKDGKIIAVGSSYFILNKFESKNKIDLMGKPVYPGFNDGHSHFYHYALNLQKAYLFDTESFDKVIEILKKHRQNYPDGWLTGMGWNQELWKDKKIPTKEMLDKEFPGIPVLLSRVDGHAVLLNSEAMKQIGLNEKSIENKEEAIWESNQLTGVFLENTADIAKNAVPRPGSDVIGKLLLQAQYNCISQGLTSVTDAGLDKQEVMLIDSMQKTGQLKIRDYIMLNPNEENFESFIKIQKINTGLLNVRSLKLYADGTLGSRGACLKQCYQDAPGQFGILVKSPKQLKNLCQLAYQNGYQVNTHCIGDSAVSLMLHIYAEILEGKNDLRWRIEHAQVVDPEDLPLFGKYSIIPSVQTTHATSDMAWAIHRIGNERIKYAYAYRSLLEQNGWIINGTDFPIENISPILTFYAAVARKDIHGNPTGGFQPENALSREAALKSITIWPAKGSFGEKEKGSIEPGKIADFIILEEDLMTVPEAKIPFVKIVNTYINGEKVY